MFDTTYKPTNDPKLDAKYQAAMASIRAKQTRQAAGGHAVLAGLAAYGEAEQSGRTLSKLAKAAQYFLIAFVCIAPNVLFLRFMM